MTVQAASSMAPSSPATLQRSPWHSPVPYLFGGLAAMLGLIAFALMILACSYWKLSGDVDNDADGDRDRDLEAGNVAGDFKQKNHKEPSFLEEKYLVIMAGQAKPTFLATPISSRAMPFGSCSCRSNPTSSSSEKSSASEVDTTEEKENQESSDQVRVDPI